MIPPNTKRGRHSESENEENKDRLSDLPDCVILHILSFLKAKYAVRTCILSTRWKDIWKRLPILLLHSTDFSSLKSFTKFVSRLLSLRDGSIALQCLDLKRSNCIELPLLKRIVNYGISHNVKQLGISVDCDLHHIPPCVFSCQTLTSLKLSLYRRRYGGGKTLFPKSLNLPALTSLHLGNFTFSSDNGRAEPFSAFTRLNSLIIDYCALMDATILCISSTTLVSLTTRNPSMDFCKIELSTPNLHTFAFTGTPYQLLCGSNLSSVKKVTIDADMLSKSTVIPWILLSWLLLLSNIKSLTVSASTFQVLFLIPNLMKAKPLFLGNLKSLKVKLEPLSFGLSMILRPGMSRKAAAKSWKAGLDSEPSSLIPDGILDFLLQNTPSAEVDIIDCSR